VRREAWWTWRWRCRRERREGEGSQQRRRLRMRTTSWVMYVWMYVCTSTYMWPPQQPWSACTSKYTWRYSHIDIYIHLFALFISIYLSIYIYIGTHVPMYYMHACTYIHIPHLYPPTIYTHIRTYRQHAHDTTYDTTQTTHHIAGRGRPRPGENEEYPR